MTRETDLFTEDPAVPPHTPAVSMLALSLGALGQPLSPTQQRFNRLLARDRSLDIEPAGEVVACALLFVM